jgi:hypothetical protein
VDVQKTGCRRDKIAQWCYHVAGDFGTLTALACPRPGAAILLHAWPYEVLHDEFRCGLSAWVRQLVDGLGTLGAVGGLEHTVGVSWQMCRSRWRRWCQGLVGSRAVERWLSYLGPFYMAYISLFKYYLCIHYSPA